MLQCNTGNAELFFSNAPGQAIELCLDCPAMIPCRDQGRDEGHIYGVWGGETAEERCDWLVNHHPNPEVRAMASAKIARLENQRVAHRRIRAARKEARAKAAGEPPPDINDAGLTLQQRRAARRAWNARQMSSQGYTAREIAEEMGTSQRQVERYLSAKYDKLQPNLLRGSTVTSIATTRTKFINPRSVAAHYFRPSEFAEAFALVLKPRVIMPTGADGKSEVLCSAIVFETEDSLEAGRPTRVLADTVVNASVLYKQLVRAYDQGGVIAGFLVQGDLTEWGTRPWIVRELDPETQARVEQVWNELVEVPA